MGIDDDLLSAEIGLSEKGASAKLTLGAKFTNFLSFLLPSMAAKAQFKGAIASAILDRLQNGIPPTAADVRYVTATCGEPQGKWLRQLQVAHRAANAIKDREAAGLQPPIPQPQLPPPADSSAPRTAEDWLSKFWDDAGLVSDETLQEIYARILGSEACSPGTCSLRTLRTLRYLDRDTADLFARVLPAVFDATWIPRYPGLYATFNINYGILLDLNDAGLLDSSPGLNNNIHADDWFPRSGRWVLSVKPSKGFVHDAFFLTRSGRELARVAQIPRDHGQFLSVAK